MLQKNDLIDLEIIDMTPLGEAIAKHDGFILFVKGGVTGDFATVRVLKVNKNFGYAKIEKIITPSNKRQNPPCGFFKKCGGCTIMNVEYSEQLKLKSNFVLNNLVKIGGYNKEEFEFEEILPAPNPYNYRNKAQFPVADLNGKAVMGFYQGKTHNVVPIDNCLIQDDLINKVAKISLDFINREKIPHYNEETKKGIIKHIYIRSVSGQIMIVLVTNFKKPLKNISHLVEMLRGFCVKSIFQNINLNHNNVILGDKNILLYGDDKIKAKLFDLEFELGPNSFFQVNTEQTEHLYSKVIEYLNLQKSDTVFDLYCGAGTISLCLAKYVKEVIGVEIVGEAVKNAKKNAKINDIKNARFFEGDCSFVVEKLYSEKTFANAVVVDPPRKGCSKELLELIVKMNPKKIVYVSCNSATLSRDVKFLKENGFQMQKVTPVDMFPNTAHVETVVLMSRENH